MAETRVTKRIEWLTNVEEHLTLLEKSWKRLGGKVRTIRALLKGVKAGDRIVVTDDLLDALNDLTALVKSGPSVPHPNSPTMACGPQV